MKSGHQDQPLRGFAGLRRHFRNDLVAGFSVSLIAMPLCLGIALASGMPPIAGLFTAIIGGIFASRFAGSFVTISGPAAGLIVINLAAVESLGAGDPAAGYPFALAAFVVGGLIVAGFGLLRVGKFGDFFPGAAVHGMLAAIGIIIMVKQAFTALGVQPPKAELLETIAHLPEAFSAMNPEVFAIAIIALTVLIIHPRLKVKWIRAVPAPLWVLAATIPMSHAFDLFHEHHYHFMGQDFELGPKYLVNLPDKISDGIVFPDFGKFATSEFWIAVVSIALVSGLESLLSAKAVDSIDPWKRQTNYNADLLAMGGGSALAGLVGGLPMISEIVRSSANINNGARTQWSNFFHGLFLLAFLLLLAPIIEQIPMSALAAMLIFTGYRLASPREFLSMWKIGIIQFSVFVTTAIVVIATDLLIGIAVGILLEAILQILSGAPFGQIFRAKTTISKSGETTTIKVIGALVFSNYLSLKAALKKAATTPVLIVDMADVKRIDHTCMHNFHQLEHEIGRMGVRLSVINMDHLHGVTDHPHSDHTTVKRNAPLPRLNKRQMELLQFAGENMFPYQPRLFGRIDGWENYLIMGGKSIVKVENKILVKLESCEVTVADLHLRAGAYFTEGESAHTYLRVELKGPAIPSFRLEEETVMDRIRDNVTNEDIDFQAYQVFSNKFLLRGEVESQIRDFFTEDRIQLMDKMHDFEMESDGESLLIRYAGGLLPVQEYAGWVKKGCEIAEVFSLHSVAPHSSIPAISKEIISSLDRTEK